MAAKQERHDEQGGAVEEQGGRDGEHGVAERLDPGPDELARALASQAA